MPCTHCCMLCLESDAGAVLQAHLEGAHLHLRSHQILCIHPLVQNACVQSLGISDTHVAGAGLLTGT